MTDLITAEDVERILNLLRSETEAASRTDAADMIEALHAELAQARADAKAAVAVAVEKARNTLASLQEWSPYEAGSPESAAWIKGATGVAERADAAIASIVPEDAIAEVARLRQNAEATNGVWQANLRLIAERDRLAAELAAANAREAGLREALINRDGGSHDEDCKARRYANSNGPCNCGHDEALAALSAAQPAGMAGKGE